MNRALTSLGGRARKPRAAAVTALALAALAMVIAAAVPGSDQPAQAAGAPGPAGAVQSAGTAPAAGSARATGSAARSRPNVVVVMTDDQDLATMRSMSKVRRHLTRRGTSFEQSLATFPLCCPSRATFLTGQYAHNHGVLDNKPPLGGHPAFDDRGSLPVALRRAGYRTGFVGKYLNRYGAPGHGGPRAVPRGWSDWRALTGDVAAVHSMYDYRLNQNGRIRSYGNKPRDYQTDVLARKAARFVRDSARRSRPFFLTLSTLAPHTEHGRPKRVGRNPQAAPRHARAFEKAGLPGNPSFNEADVSDKPAFVRETQRLRPLAVRLLKERHQDRLASMLAVDDAVGRLVGELRRAGVLERTVIIFTSDNGYLLGAHRLRSKQYLYEESARVPLVMRGPGIPRGEVREQVVGNIDLAPTILDYANADPLLEQDGRSLRRLARKPKLGTERSILLENRSSVAVRTPDYMYAEHSGGETELYDLRRDPFQLESLHDDPRYADIRAQLAERLAELRDCAGNGCR